MTFQEHQITIEGTKINYFEGGVFSSNPPILFLHGWALSASAFYSSLSSLTNLYRVVAPDLPGFGRSSYTHNINCYKDYSDLLLSFIGSLNIKKCHLVGHSMGGGISIILTAAAPNKIVSLSLIDSTGIPLMFGFHSIFRKLANDFLQVFQTRFTSNLFPYYLSAMYNTILRYRTSKKLMRIPEQEDVRYLLAAIKVPCQIVWGDNDRVIPLDYGKELSHNIKNSKLIILDDTFHDWSALMPQLFKNIICSFIKEVNIGEKKFANN